MTRLCLVILSLALTGCAGSIPQSPVLAGLGDGMVAGAQTYRPPRPVNCSTNSVGGTAFTNCY